MCENNEYQHPIDQELLDISHNLQEAYKNEKTEMVRCTEFKKA